MAIGNVDVSDCIFLRASFIDRHDYFHRSAGRSQGMTSLDFVLTDFDWLGGTVAPAVNESKHYELDSIEDVDGMFLAGFSSYIVHGP